MKIKSITTSKLFILLVFLLTGFSIVIAQKTKPSKETQNALNELLSNTKKEKKIEYTDREELQEQIKSAFLKWSQKVEFEKQADYKVRIQKQSQSKFTEICIEEIKKKINSFRPSDLNINLLIYDAENEFFPIVFKFKEKKWEKQVKISIDKAQNFKEAEWHNLQWKKEESDWCFIYNDLFPSKIYLNSNSYDITFKLPLLNQEEIKFAFNDFGIENLYLNKFIFNYLKATEKEKDHIIYSPDGVANARKNYETGVGLDDKGGYIQSKRTLINKKNIVSKCYDVGDQGIVVVSVEIDRDGKVISATPGVKGTTTNSKCLFDTARQMAMETKFNSDPKAPASQSETIIYKFTFSK